jgi:hypothetical protein
MQAGEQAAWETLAALDPREVCRRTRAVFDRQRGVYRLDIFSRNALISPSEKTISGGTLRDGLLLDRLQDHAALPILGYLIHAQDIPLTGRLIKPSSMKGGQIYLTGAHVLPLHKITGKYGNDREAFLTRGCELGGEEIPSADAAVRLFPFPRIALALILWLEDEEFGARSDLLMDSTGELQLPPDLLWMTAMMSVLAML